MDKSTKQEILHSIQIKKFSAYGFLKNLRFFEPYLLIFLLGNGLSLFQIGLLYSIREIVTNLFEVPSGIVADYFGKKKELCLCFISYILSFILFFLCQSFSSAAIAMVFFGLGEALRSGTHKAMIYTYLEHKHWTNYKTFVYGKTRSSSLLGSAISSALSIILILNLPSSNYIFLASIIPYLLDFALIASYPSYLDAPAMKNNQKFTGLAITALGDLIKNKPLRHLLIGNGIFEASIDSIKDLIQPILETIIVGSGLLLLTTATPEDNLKIILGLVYGLVYLISALASRKSYLLRQATSGEHLLNILYVSLALATLSLALWMKQPLFVIGLFLIMYILRNLRKPIYVDIIDDYMKAEERATVLSVSSQLKSLILVILAPLVGYVADHYAMNQVMLLVGGLLLILYPFIRINRAKKATPTL